MIACLLRVILYKNIWCVQQKKKTSSSFFCSSFSSIIFFRHHRPQQGEKKNSPPSFLVDKNAKKWNKPLYTKDKPKILNQHIYYYMTSQPTTVQNGFLQYETREAFRKSLDGLTWAGEGTPITKKQLERAKAHQALLLRFFSEVGPTSSNRIVTSSDPNAAALPPSLRPSITLTQDSTLVCPLGQRSVFNFFSKAWWAFAPPSCFLVMGVPSPAQDRTLTVGRKAVVDDFVVEH